MNAQVAIGVVTVPGRLAMGEALASSLGARLFCDTELRGPGAMHAEAWATLIDQEDAEYVCVLDDDAEPTQSFLDDLRRVIEGAPEDLVSLYAGTGRPAARTRELGRGFSRFKPGQHGFVKSPGLWWGVGQVAPADMMHGIPDLALRFTDEIRRLGWDEALGRAWILCHRTPVLYAVPCLVDHADVGSTHHRAAQGARKAIRVGSWAQPASAADSSGAELKL